MTIQDMTKELEMLKRRYASELETMADRVKNASAQLAEGKIYGSSAFNMGATASELATLAGKIEQTENVIRWMQEAK